MPRVTGTLPGWLPAVNRVMTLLQRLGLAVGPVQVLVVPGRRSGTPRETPVSPFEVDGRCYVAAAHARGFMFLGVGSDVSFVIAGARRELDAARGALRGA